MQNLRLRNGENIAATTWVALFTIMAAIGINQMTTIRQLLKRPKKTAGAA